MKNFKEIAEKCLRGELSGTFIFKNEKKVSSNALERNTNAYNLEFPYKLNGISLSQYGTSLGLNCYFDIIDFIPDIKEKKKIEIPIPEGFELNLQESTKNKAIVQEKVKYPQSWIEYLQIHPEHQDISIKVPSSISIELLNYVTLLLLRQEWIHIWSQEQGLKEDWEPDWYDSCTTKYCINYVGKNLLEVVSWGNMNHSLSFPTEELAKKFMYTFKDLLEQAKGLY